MTRKGDASGRSGVTAALPTFLGYVTSSGGRAGGPRRLPFSEGDVIGGSGRPSVQASVSTLHTIAVMMSLGNLDGWILSLCR